MNRIDEVREQLRCLKTRAYCHGETIRNITWLLESLEQAEAKVLSFRQSMSAASQRQQNEQVEMENQAQEQADEREVLEARNKDLRAALTEVIIGALDDVRKVSGLALEQDDKAREKLHGTI